MRHQKLLDLFDAPATTAEVDNGVAVRAHGPKIRHRIDNIL
jgi:hypothetical protein